MPRNNTHVIILAAGQGKRMGGDQPKVLATLAGRPLVDHVLRAVDALEPDAIHVVVGHGAAAVQDACEGPGRRFVNQSPQLGTGHAAMQALPDIPADGRALILLGDAPLVTVQTMQRALAAATAQIAVVTARLPDPTGYGRIVRDTEGIARIVEHRDASPDELAINEINSGMIAAPAGLLRELLEQVDQDNAQTEYYLTDIVGLARARGIGVAPIEVDDRDEVAGANDRWQLAQLERRYQRRQARRLCEQGALLMDPDRVDVRGEVTLDGPVRIDVNVVFEGRVHLGAGTQIGPNCLIRDARLGRVTRVHPMSIIEEATTEGDCDIGPFARIRPGTRLGKATKVGNFVETKNIVLGNGSKASHLTYLGDAVIGADVNVGAGTITCNYDGVNKHRTEIGDGAFIGSGTQLVAPVKVGANATIGAGSVISADAPADKLTLSRGRARTIDGWRRPKKKETR